MKILCVFGEYAYGDPLRGNGYEYINFIPSLQNLGHEVRLFDSFDRQGYTDFADLNLQLLDVVQRFQPDIIFSALMGYEIWLETLDLIRHQTPVRWINWGTDDSWKFKIFSQYIALHVDLHVTTCHEAHRAAQAKGLRRVFLSQWGASRACLAPPLASEDCRYDVSFVGAAYGNRRQWIAQLADLGIQVHCFGHGWDGGAIATEEILNIYRQSRLSLNFSDSGLQLDGLRLRYSRQIKARTFEVPAAGGCLLTQVSDELGHYFKVGQAVAQETEQEVATFQTLEELASQIRYYLAHPQARDALAQAGHLRVCHHHTYEQRLSEIFAEADRHRDRDRPSTWPAQPTPDPLSPISPLSLEPLVQHHRDIPAYHGMLRDGLCALGRLLWGDQRGRRAARRILFEFSHRCLGASTYTSRGLPGRLFYLES